MNKLSIGLLGGMFDPVHIGHIETALLVQQALSLDEVRLMPCARPAHRDPAKVSDTHRLNMLRLSVERFPGLMVDDRECRRLGVSYTVDSLLSLKQEFPQAVLYFVLGLDAFCALETWSRWQQVFKLCHLVVINRPGYELRMPEQLAWEYDKRKTSQASDLVQCDAGKILVNLQSEFELSSTQVRQQLKDGIEVMGVVSKPVAGYIAEHHLFEG